MDRDSNKFDQARENDIIQNVNKKNNILQVSNNHTEISSIFGTSNNFKKLNSF